MRFFVVPGIGQLELNGERSSGRRVVRSPPKLRPAAATLSYFGYSGPAYAAAAARTLRERMGSRLTAMQ